MSIPSEIQIIIDRLNEELVQIEQEATQGMNLLRPLLELFPNNDIIVSFFASLNNSLFLVEIYKRRLDAIVELLLPENVTEEIVQNAGEELGDLLGRALESKIGLGQIIERLERLQ
jgi:hypothetical protein